MNKFWLLLAAGFRACRKRYEELFVSKGSGISFMTKSVKRNEIPQKGQFNIMESYRQQKFLHPDKEIGKVLELVFDFRYGFILKNDIDTKANYEEARDFFVKKYSRFLSYTS